MTIDVLLTDSDRVDARLGELTLSTAQDGSAPAPFDLFLASMATCAGFYVSKFCRQRGIDPTTIALRQRIVRDPDTRMLSRVELDIDLPPGFPEKYRAPVVRAAEQCSVTRHLQNPPEVKVGVAVPTG